ncbi:hypothetical protein K523DRAFT_422250 [Schizophyllum commune Tattone D]|nr:hypothetical protein K523DRAFT_422250 [Schizophyllum commune Tattone D]
MFHQCFVKPPSLSFPPPASKRAPASSTAHSSTHRTGKFAVLGSARDAHTHLLRPPPPAPPLLRAVPLPPSPVTRSKSFPLKSPQPTLPYAANARARTHLPRPNNEPNGNAGRAPPLLPLLPPPFTALSTRERAHSLLRAA